MNPRTPAMVEARQDELERLRRENQALREGRLELVRELNRIIALGDFAMRCATASEPSEVLDRALQVLGDILHVDMRATFGLKGNEVDVRAFARRGRHSIDAPSGRSVPAEIAKYLSRLPVATILRVGDGSDVPDLSALLELLFPQAESLEGSTIVIIPLRPRPGEMLGAIVACKKLDSLSGQAYGPRDDDATFLVLLANHIDRALQAALLVSDLKSRSDELAESTRRFRESLENLERTQKQLLQARKLEAIGRLAGGVAHDFNNLLTVIRNHVEFLRETLPAESTELEDVQAIGEAAERATRITRQLLAFGRRNDGRPEVLDVNRVATELTRGIGQLVGEHVRIDLHLDNTIGPVRADRAQLEQVLLNLLVNARDAMPEGGVATLTTRHATMHDLTDTPLAKDPSQFVALAVSDTGHGMDEATRARLFEPFFTTKEPGQGTGLGLATVYGIVEKHRGHIAVSSQAGAGTTFTILLPSARRSAMTMEAIKRVPISSDVSQTATILLVEDDAGLRRAALRTLQSKGYSVLEARDGEDALAIVRSHAGPIDLVVTDVVMPRMAGPKLVSELRARQGNMRVIYVSGYTFDMLDPRALEDGTFLTKPFSPEDLLTAVQNVLHASGLA